VAEICGREVLGLIKNKNYSWLEEVGERRTFGELFRWGVRTIAKFGFQRLVCVVVVEKLKSAEFGSLGLASFGAGMHAVVYSCLVCSSWTEELFALNDKDRDK